METQNVIVAALLIAAAQYAEDAKRCKETAPSFAEQFARQRLACLAVADMLRARGLAALPAQVHV